MESRALQALVMIRLGLIWFKGWVYGLRFTVYGLRFTVYGLRFTVYGLRFTVYGYRLRLEVTVTGYGFHLRFGYATLCFSAARKLSD
ncbi:hypothetical protein J31TS3_37760 [Paenibacillus lactis]|nr:hypothetical protein J31TS3_37760 [Paenibacillus lactis]